MNILTDKRVFLLFIYFIAPIALLSILSSCSKDTEKGKWVKSSNGIKVYVPKDFEKNYDKKSLYCECGTSEDEITLYTPPFIISVKDKNGKSKKFKSNLPTIIPDSLLRHRVKGKDNAFWYIAGKLDKNGNTQGYAFEYEIQEDSILSVYEYGYFKDNNLSRGYRYTYNSNSGNSSAVWGRFKNDKIYQGYKQRMFPDSIGDKKIGLWASDGSYNETYLKMVRIHYAVMKKLGYDAEKTEKEDLKFTHRYFFWVNYKWFFLIGLSVVGLLFVLIGTGSIPEKTTDGNDNPEYYKLKPWTCAGAYWRWILFPFGLEYIYLRMQTWYFLISILSWTMIVASSKFLVLYGTSPEYWQGLLRYATPWQYYLFELRIGFWIGSFIWIPYYVYCDNFHTFRRNIYEKLILGNQTLKYKSLCQRIAQGFKEDHRTVKNCRAEAQQVYDQELGLGSKLTSFLTNKKVKHARNKAEALNDILYELAPIAENHANMTSQLMHFLNIERRNAYRNMILAKELILLVRNFKDHQGALETDRISRMTIERPTDIHSDPSNIPDIDFEGSAAIGFQSFDNTFSLLKDLGMKDTDNLLVSLGVGSLEFAIDGIAQINSRRTAEREHYEYQASKIITQICALEENIMANDTKMIRANEIMMALSAANEAFVRAYVPLRDSVFGKKATIGGFLSFVLKRHKKNANARVNEIAHLIQVCSLYNKINKSKI